MDAASEFNAVSRDRSVMTGDAELNWFHAAIGDHAQVSCDALGEADTPSYLKQPWTTVLSKPKTRRNALLSGAPALRIFHAPKVYDGYFEGFCSKPCCHGLDGF